MPLTAPNIDGLAPLWDFAISIGARESDLIAALRDDGVPVLEISISGKSVHFVAKGDLGQYVSRNATANLGLRTEHTDVQPTDQLDRQADQPNLARRQLADPQLARSPA
jgi:hypothetical protein